MPKADPTIDAILKLNHAPIGPVNAPIRARSSKSPSPMPSLFLIFLKILFMVHKKK